MGIIAGCGFGSWFSLLPSGGAHLACPLGSDNPAGCAALYSVSAAESAELRLSVPYASRSVSRPSPLTPLARCSFNWSRNAVVGSVPLGFGFPVWNFLPTLNAPVVVVVAVMMLMVTMMTKAL